LPGTVTRSCELWPCTSALGLITRNNSAGTLKLAPSSKLTASSLRSLSTLSSVGQESLFTIGLAEIDLAFDDVTQPGTLPGQHHLDLELPLTTQALLAHHPLDCLLGGDSYLLQELPHRHIEALLVHGPASLSGQA